MQSTSLCTLLSDQKVSFLARGWERKNGRDLSDSAEDLNGTGNVSSWKEMPGVSPHNNS